ncbi:mucin-binding protein, partial [Lactobacillus gallinarum]|uniref:mucin-binding protein n=1 Tax=Lactobacillus gallinarum TaxID=52242 RepID=UPI001959BBE1
MRNRIVTAVKQRFSIRKLSIGAASVLLGTSLYFMGGSATIVHAAAGDATQTEISKGVQNESGSAGVGESSDQQKAKLESIAGKKNNNDTTVNNAIDKYAEYALEHDLKNKDNKVIIRPSDKQPVKVNSIDDRVTQVENIQNDIQKKIDQANQGWDAINTCKKSNNNDIVDGKDSSYFENQSLSVDDEKDSEINQITVTDGSKTKNVNTELVDGTKLVDGKSKNIDGLVDGISKNIDGYGINITHTSNMTDKEREAMKVNSDNKVIVDFQTDQYQDKKINKKITVTYDHLNNSYYLENINNNTNRIKISRIDRTFSSITVADKPKLFYGGWRGNKYDDYDPCNGPQLIIYNDPSDGFFYNNIQQISVKDTYYYDDKGKQTPINFDPKDPAWVFVTSLNSNGGGNIEKVRALDSNDSPLSAQKIAGSTVTTDDHNDGWCYSDNNNNFSNNANNIFGQKLDWDSNDEYNRFGFVGTVAFQYQPGMTLQYRADDSQWGSHWACMQTQVVSSLNENVIIYGHIKDGTESVTRNDTVTRTIHYLYDNGNTAQPDKTQTVSFNETGTKDDVTGETTWSNDNAQTVDSVNTPSITGYTPDQDNVAGQTVNFGDNDINVTVHYSANTQTATITY